ncbi:right-handed parallel beta-helix repeat-containing protein [bacterium]|nr:right-handed parallel beta-helix repeat-containing protein [bacterium]
MKGDFSKWTLKPNKNFNDVLHQQGKVLLDSDWNDRVILTNHWQQRAGRDIIGAHIFAVPAHDPVGFKVESAALSGDKAELKVFPGHGWLNGYLVHLEGEGLQSRTADYLENSPGDATNIEEGITRDAVVLEIWQEAVNGYQVPDELIEPALGGPDTTERLHTAMAFKLFRLSEGDHCQNIHDKIKDDTGNSGKLEVTLTPSATSGEECPVVQSGGYTGFEHNLYRIEIAQLDNPEEGKKFKWSSLNGGLVGRGDYDATDPLKKIITITANLTAITSLYRKTFYLEIVEYNESAGNWQVIYGANTVLNGNVLELGQDFFTAKAPSDSNVFFRLWDGVELIEEYKKPAGSTLEKELQDGIRLAFDNEDTKDYRPGDYWQFTVRAGQKISEDPLLEDQIPQGPIRHRAVLAIIHWDNELTASFAEEEIDDCRRIFRPLTNQKLCCSFTIGDGDKSQGDFNDFNEALRHLPEEGGQLCLLPGVHRIHTTIKERRKIRITGCGRQTMVTCLPDKQDIPNFDIVDSQDIQIDNLTIMSMSATAIRATHTSQSDHRLEKITIKENRIVGLTHAIEVIKGRKIEISENHLSVFDKKGGGTVVFIQAEDSCVVQNTINVIPDIKQDEPGTEPDDVPETDYLDDCADPDDLYASNLAVVGLINWVFTMNYMVSVLAGYEYKARGGLQVGSSSEQLAVRHNRIIGGLGHGISLGHLPKVEGWDHDQSYIHELSPELYKLMEAKLESFIYDISIRDNAIELMGQSGISTAIFFNLDKLSLMLSLKDVEIIGNTITHCAQQNISSTVAGTATSAVAAVTAGVNMNMAYGGVVLADAENVIIRENRIEENGLSHLQAICGIWIGQGEKIEISDNRIINNAPRTSLEDEGAAKGWRGGIVIRLSLNKIMEDILASLTGDEPTMFQDSLPAAKIHDNTVVQPLGQALILLAMGPVSVANNHFASQGTVNVLSEEMKLNYDYIAMLGATVIIANLGIAKDIFPLLLMGSFAQLGKMSIGNEFTRSATIGTAESAEMSINENPGMAVAIDVSALNLAALLYLPSGQIMFNDNRTTLDLRSPAMSVLLSSQTMISLDDISFANNQSEIASVLKFDKTNTAAGEAVSAITEMDIAGNNTILMAFTVRATNNRFQDGLTQGIPQKGFSLFSYGMMNTTIGNQATNCLLPLGPAAFNLKLGNTVIFHQRCPEMTVRLIAHFGLASANKRLVADGR